MLISISSCRICFAIVIVMFNVIHVIHLTIFALFKLLVIKLSATVNIILAMEQRVVLLDLSCCTCDQASLVRPPLCI